MTRDRQAREEAGIFPYLPSPHDKLTISHLLPVHFFRRPYYKCFPASASIPALALQEDFPFEGIGLVRGQWMNHRPVISGGVAARPSDCPVLNCSTPAPFLLSLLCLWSEEGEFFGRFSSSSKRRVCSIYRAWEGGGANLERAKPDCHTAYC